MNSHFRIHKEIFQMSSIMTSFYRRPCDISILTSDEFIFQNSSRVLQDVINYDIILLTSRRNQYIDIIWIHISELIQSSSRCHHLWRHFTDVSLKSIYWHHTNSYFWIHTEISKMSSIMTSFYRRLTDINTLISYEFTFQNSCKDLQDVINYDVILQTSHWHQYIGHHMISYFRIHTEIFLMSSIMTSYYRRHYDFNTLTSFEFIFQN
jgi:hypothetical protein